MFTFKYKNNVLPSTPSVLPIQLEKCNFDFNYIKQKCLNNSTSNYPFDNRSCKDTEKLKKHLDNRIINLSLLNDIFKKYNVIYCLCGGSLLGPFRDGDLVLNDYDDDLWIFSYISNDCIDELLINKFTIERYEGTYVISIMRNGCPIDLCFKYELDDYLYTTPSPRKHVFTESKKFYENLKTIQLRGVDYPIPDYTERYIDFMYKDWKIPNSFGMHRGNNNPNDPYIVFLKEEEEFIDIDKYKKLICPEGKINIFFV